MPAGIRLTNQDKKFILENYTNCTSKQIASHLGISTETVSKILRKDEKKCRRSYQRKYIALDKKRISCVLESFATNGYSVKIAAQTCDISYLKASWYIKHHYTRKMLTESTQVLTIQSAV